MTYDAWNSEQSPQDRFSAGPNATPGATQNVNSSATSGTDIDRAVHRPGDTAAGAMDRTAEMPSVTPSALANAPAPTPMPPAITTPMPNPTPSPTAAPVQQSVPSAGWSSFGATPSRPPTVGGSAAGPAQYLPPVAPPTTQVAATPKPAKNPRWGWRAVVSFLAGGLIAAAGFGAAQLNATGDGSVETTADVTLPVTTLPPVRNQSPVPTVPLDAAEPAEFVARTLGPSVVQIDTDFGVGSGVIFGDGLILTNNHVIDGALNVAVMLSDGREFEAEILGRDINTDVAVLSVGPGLGLPIAKLATGEKARVGQIAVAIGSPFDLQQSVTAGIVSAVDRPIQNSETSVVAMIQTDAPINPGNSGGALADRLGRVIGINTSIQTDGLSSANVGVGFAVPIDTAIRIADLLVAGSPIEPGFLGVRGEQTGEAGVVLTEVTAESAAEDAGLLIGDRVLTFNGAPVTEFVELAGLVLANQAGDTITMGVVRDGELLEIQVILGLREN